MKQQPILSHTSAFALPYTPYEPQQQLMDTIAEALDRVPTSSSSSRMVAAELPTGTGKTVALLSAVLSWQNHVEHQGTVFEQDSYFLERCRCNYCDAERDKRKKSAGKSSTATARGRRGRRGGAGTSDDTDHHTLPVDTVEAEWTASPLLFQQFRNLNAKRLRVEGDQRSSSTLRKHHLVPPCTIFYATRTHSQLHQAVRELRRFDDAWTPALKFNILASRAHLCVNRKVRNLVASKSVTVERNNLGELCDKLVAVHQCEAVESFTQLASRALLVPLHEGQQHGGDGTHVKKTSKNNNKSYAWDIEDLVKEGVAMNACPYYASRELVHYSNINFCTYMYLLDPVIRKECKFEAAIKNHSVIVFDEAHNVGPVCQDVLSIETPVQHLLLIRAELEPLTAGVIADGGGTANNNNNNNDYTMTYNREFKLTKWTLRELFTFLDHDVIAPLVAWTTTTADGIDGNRSANNSAAVVFADLLQTTSLATSAVHRVLLHLPPPTNSRGGEDGPDSPRMLWLQQFKQIYGVVMALGVTFNPFNLSVWALGVLKRLLVVLRFALLNPKSFAVWTEVKAPLDNNAATVHSVATLPLVDVVDPNGGGVSRHSSKQNHPFQSRGPARPSTQNPNPVNTTSTGGTLLHIRCLDGSLALHHLARSCYAVVLASGTLSPMSQLRTDLKLPHATVCLETDHVVDVEKHFRFGVLTRLCNAGGGGGGTVPLLCNFQNLQNDAFLHQLTQECLTIVGSSLPRGSGALIFVPNYRVAKVMYEYALRLLQQAAQRKRDRGVEGHDNNHATTAPLDASSPFEAMSCFIEPREAEKMEQLLDSHRRAVGSLGKRSVIFSVYRGKVSEGLDFADDLGRLVLCVGLPLQPLLSRSVEAQRAYSGEAWYRTDAVKAVNQAMGRCLRHVKDYGAVVLLDERYAAAADGAAALKHQLPKWCREELQVWSSSAEVLHCFRHFFHGLHQSTAVRCPPSRNECVRPRQARSADEDDNSRGGQATRQPPPSLFFGTLSGVSPSAPASKHRTGDSAQEDEHQPVKQRNHSSSQHLSRTHSTTTTAAPSAAQLLRSTALKLLYEEADDVASIRRDDVEERVRLLEAVWWRQEEENI
ncbi:DEAD/DEAH box RNA helicase, putative [Bodo saltans]|uniref:DEAD/DEAH box RNA helicase, putative n=1 Tax=Bodo saltans TaxID=75058 RepID=A0A0S4IQT3_BODSA|nr:DEAD/DEAH box RNA helicase, putative [Bodo saltans]|eukprot:CUF28197.1 DEAD/DEAH box RNA helicase, putative [Bodo saltans]